MNQSVSVEIDQQVMVDAVREVVQKGLSDGVGSWETQRLIREAVEKAVDTSGLPSLIEEALNGRIEAEAGEIVATIMDDAVPMIREAFRLTFRKSLRAMVYGLLLGTPTGGYLTDEQKAAWREAQSVLGEETETVEA